MTSDITQKQQEIAELREKLAALESEVASRRTADQWDHSRFYGTFYGTVGFVDVHQRTIVPWWYNKGFNIRISSIHQDCVFITIIELHPLTRNSIAVTAWHS